MNEENLPVSVNKRPKFFRRQYFIDPPLQLKLVLFFLFLSIGQLAVFFIIHQRAVSRFSEVISSVSFDAQAVHTMLLSLEQTNITFNYYFTIFGAISLLYGLIAGILLSHSLAGPLFAIKRFVRSLLADEKPIPLHLRKTDFLIDFSHDLNMLAKKFRPEFFETTQPPKTPES